MTSSTTDRRLGLTGSAAIKVPCKAATTAAITLSGEQTVDGVSCVTGDRVLVRSQTSSVDNGIYVCDTGTWTRDLDFDGPNDVTTGTIIMVLNGSANTNTYWRLTTTGTITFGSSAITFSSALAGDSALVSFLQSGNGAIAESEQSRERWFVLLTDFLSDVDRASLRGGSTVNCDTAYSNASTAITNDGVILVPAVAGIYLFTAGLLLGASGKAARMVGIGKPNLKFSGLSASTDCMTLTGASYRQVELRNFIIDCNSIGRDGLVLTMSDHPIIDNVKIKNTVRDGFAISPSGFEWIENGRFNVFVETAGRHGIRLSLAGANGAFINESSFYNCEVRGVSRVTAGGNAVRATSTASSGASKFASISWHDCNFDAQALASPLPSVNPMEIDSGVAQNWQVFSGGWENLGVGVVTGGPMIKVSGTGNGGSFLVLSPIPSNWGQGFTGSGLTNSVIYDSNGTVFYVQPSLGNTYTDPIRFNNTRWWEDSTILGGHKQLRAKAAVPGSAGDGIAISMGQHQQVGIATSSTGNLDFPLAVLTGMNTDKSQTFILTITNSQFVSSGNVAQRVYHVMIRGDAATVVPLQIVDASTANMIASVAFSVVSSTTLRVAITTGTAWGTGGGSAQAEGLLLGWLPLQ